MRTSLLGLGALLMVSCARVEASEHAALSDDELADQLRDLQDKVAALQHQVGVQEDIEAIRLLMYTYAYYMDRALFAQVFDLFAEDMESCEAGGRGVYKGKARCIELWQKIWGVYGGAENKLKYGQMVEHFVTKLVITVAPDRKTAKSRGHYLGFGGVFNMPQYSAGQTGIYQLDYAKDENGVWKIKKFYLPFTTTGYNFTTWAGDPGYSGCQSADVPPDEPTTNYHPFPEVYVVPFHYPNPGSGKEVAENGYTDPQHYWIGNWPGQAGQCGHE